MATKIAKRGYVVVYRDGLTKSTKVTAIVQRADAESLKRKVGGTVVSVNGMAYRMAQRTLRVLVDPAEAIALAAVRN